MIFFFAKQVDVKYHPAEGKLISLTLKSDILLSDILLKINLAVFALYHNETVATVVNCGRF